MSLKYFLTDYFVLIQITFRISSAKLQNFLVAKSSKQRPIEAWKILLRGFRTFFASNSKFGISLNKIFASKNVLVILSCFFELFFSKK